jgi:hypothetical protein
MFCVAILLGVVRMSSAPLILRNAPTDPPCAEPQWASSFPGRGHREPQGEPGVLVRWRKTLLWLPQGIGDLRHSQTMATDDLGLGLARLNYALLPALLCQGNLRFQAYEALLSP